MKNLIRLLLVAGGSICVALAIVGIFVPVLPTTPFLLLAAMLYARSSVRFYTWLTTNRLFGAYIRNYREGRGITLLHKVVVMALLWLTIGYAALFTPMPWWVKLILLGIAIGVPLHLVRIKTLKPGEINFHLPGEINLPDKSV